MEKIFYTNTTAYPSSTDAVKDILVRFFQVDEPQILRTESGKPYLANGQLFFSISHTKEGLFIAVCDQNVGIDAEKLHREVNLPLLVKRFSSAEQKSIGSTADFLAVWTAKEAAVKWLGGTLASDLRNLVYLRNRMYYKNLELPVCLTRREYAGHILSVCSERDFSLANVIIL